MSPKGSTPVMPQLGFSRMGTQVIDFKQVFGFARTLGVFPLPEVIAQLSEEMRPFPTKLSTG
ncbi:hypothetical protein [Roseateles depolymerans]|uniref:hypothetical protein n=1 Tax=Roseateles depolymerans TaxID=76731 RepID=UPI001475AF99|nr:hypothetical protein [Roseateles depolymerans]